MSEAEDPPDDPLNGWTPLLEELERRRDASRAMGGPERLERLVYGRGRLDARQRLARLFDPGTFVEIGALVGGAERPSDAFVAGFGTVGGRPVAAGAEDFSVLGGSIGPGTMAKRHRVCEIALRERIPLVTLLEGAGHRLSGDAGSGRAPNDLLALADLSGEVPTVCLVLGASAGHGALAAPLADFVVMTETACLFTGGPPLVRAALGEEVTQEDLGGARQCAEVAGTAHNVAPDDAAAIALARRYLGHFPSRRGALPPRREGPDTDPRRLEQVLRIVPPDPRRPYDVHPLLDELVDAGSLLEVQPGYGGALVTALAFLGGRSVAILASNPAVRAGAIDSPAAVKAAAFIETADAFGLPLVFLADNPGVMAGRKAERDGILKWGGRMFRAQRRARVPKLHVTLRKSFGFGSSVMAQNPFDQQTLTFALPGVTLDAMPAASGGRAARLGEAEQAAAEARQRAGPWRMAEGLVYDDVIDPRELRNALLAGLALLEGRRAGRPGAED